MNNKQKSVTIIFGILLAVIVIAVGFMFFGGINFSQGIILRADNGACLLIKGSEPIVLSGMSKNQLEKLETGDKVFVAHGGIAESYPAQTSAYFCIRLSKGHEINKDVMSILSELGWIQSPSRNIAFSAQYIRTNGEYPAPHCVVISSKEELMKYYESNKHIFDLERKEQIYSDTTIGFLDACDRYDDEYFADSILVLAIITEPSGSNSHEVENVKTENGELVITINRLLPEIGTCDMACWHIFVELNKADIANCKDVWLEINE